MKPQDHGFDEGRADVEQRALMRARELVDRMRSLYRELETATGAPVVVHRALAIIDAQPGIPASRLAEALGLQRSTMSHVLKALALKNWIERRRSDEDQRSVRVHVTAAGRSVLQATSGRVSGVLQRAVRQIDTGQLRQLDQALEVLLRHIGPARPMSVAARGRARPPRKSP